MLATDADAVAVTVGNDEDRPALREVVRALEEIDAGLEHRAAPPFHAHPIGDLRGGDVALVVRGGVAEDEANAADVPRFVRAAQLMRSAMQTRAFSWNLYAAAPDIDRVFAQEAERQGTEAASATEKVRPQVGGGVRAG